MFGSTNLAILKGRDVSFLQRCDDYLAARTGKYEWRRVRYLATLAKLREWGLDHGHTLFDVGAGWTELDYCLRTDGQWCGRYIPVDGGIDGTNLDQWIPPRNAEYFVALELLEHLHYPFSLVCYMQVCASVGVIVSTPNPGTTDVLGMDATHVTPISAEMLMRWGFTVELASFYGKRDDSLFAWWRRNG